MTDRPIRTFRRVRDRRGDRRKTDGGRPPIALAPNDRLMVGLYDDGAALTTQRPKTRDDCPAHRPCPWVGCWHHLWLDVTRNGSIKMNSPDVPPWDYSPSCSLDVAERGGMTLEDVGRILNITREAVRLIQVRALQKLRATVDEEVTPDPLRPWPAPRGRR